MAKGGIRCWRDQTSELQTCAEGWLEKGDFPLLEAVKILYTWVDPPRLDSNGMEMLGQARKLPNNMRDVFGIDFVVEIAQSKWKEMTEEERSRLIRHELLHLCVKLTNAGDVSMDSRGRVKIYLARHDINFNEFAEQLSIFGLSLEEVALIRTLTKVARRGRKEGGGSGAAVEEGGEA